MTKIQKTDNTKFWQECEATRTRPFMSGAIQNGTALEGSLAFFYKINHTLTI